MVSPHPAHSHRVGAHAVPGSGGVHFRAQLITASSLDMALVIVENMWSAVLQTHDPISDGLY